MRELQDKIANLGKLTTTLQADNETLKRELTRFATENEILRATSQQQQQQQQRHHNDSPSDQPRVDDRRQPPVPGPMKFSPTDFHRLVAHEGTQNPPHVVSFDEETGEKLLDAAATWDLIQNHELFKRGLVDIADVSDRLKGMARCNGHGPAYKESHVLNAIQESFTGGSDELI